MGNRNHRIDSYSIQGYKVKAESYSKDYYSRTDYFYDSINRLIKTNETDTGLIDTDIILTNYSLLYKYDNKNRVIEEKIKHGESIERTEYLYRDIGSVTEQTKITGKDTVKKVHYANSKLQDTLITEHREACRNMYDSKGNLTSSFMFDSSGAFIRGLYFIYDDNNNMMEQGIYKIENGGYKKLIMEKYVYTFDR